MAASYGLTEEQHEMATNAIANNLEGIDGYTIKEMDEDILEIWSEDETDENHKDFYKLAIGSICRIDGVYVVNSGSRTIGELVVY